MYLLDTNILSELIKKRPNPKVLSQLRSKSSLTLYTSCICIMELRFGSALRDVFLSRNRDFVVGNVTTRKKYGVWDYGLGYR